MKYSLSAHGLRHLHAAAFLVAECLVEVPALSGGGMDAYGRPSSNRRRRRPQATLFRKLIFGVGRSVLVETVPAARPIGSTARTRIDFAIPLQDPFGGRHHGILEPPGPT